MYQLYKNMTEEFQKQDIIQLYDFNLVDSRFKFACGRAMCASPLQGDNQLLFSYRLLITVGQFATRWRERVDPPSFDNCSIFKRTKQTVSLHYFLKKAVFCMCNIFFLIFWMFGTSDAYTFCLSMQKPVLFIYAR